jgi:transposase
MLIESKGADLAFLPPYSPDLNPIGNVFAKIKQSRHSLACRPRDFLWRTMQSVLDQIAPAEAANSFCRCGRLLRRGRSGAIR